MSEARLESPVRKPLKVSGPPFPHLDDKGPGIEPSASPLSQNMRTGLQELVSKNIGLVSPKGIVESWFQHLLLSDLAQSLQPISLHFMVCKKKIIAFLRI